MAETKIEFKNISESQVTITQLMLPSHSNFSGKIHGGHILNMMDQIAFACASKHSGNYCVTGLRVESENIRTGEKKHCNSSYFTMIAKDNLGKSAPVPGIVLTSKNEIRRFARSITRQNESKNRTSRFSSKAFKIEDYLQLFENSNSKIDLKEK